MAVLVVASIVLFFLLRFLRKLNLKPKYVPGAYLKKKWNNWTPGGVSYGHVPDRAGSPSVREDTAYRGSTISTSQPTRSNVRRDTSIRSIITLPSYSLSPKPTEQVVAREGEREGMDVVVEFPETADEEESRREEHMEALYQVRLQRRQEHDERERRRRERRDALARGDYDRLEQLRREQARDNGRRSEGRNRGMTTSQATQLALQRSRERERRISSVSYAALGYVRHDGSRVRGDGSRARAGSAGSDRNPLLAPIPDANEDASGNHSLQALPEEPEGHGRGGSVSSISTGGSGNGGHLTPVTSNAPLNQSSMYQDDGDVANLSIPPPEYDNLDWGDAPAHESHRRTLTQDQQNAQEDLFRPVPTIHVDAADRDSDSAFRLETEGHPLVPESSDDHSDSPTRGDAETAWKFPGSGSANSSFEMTRQHNRNSSRNKPSLPPVARHSSIKIEVLGLNNDSPRSSLQNAQHQHPLHQQLDDDDSTHTM